MLVLVRTEGKKVMIGDDVTVEVLSIGKHQVKLGFTAPSGTAIHREEIYLRIKNNTPEKNGEEK